MMSNAVCWTKYVFVTLVLKVFFVLKTNSPLSYPNFVRGLLFDGMQSLIDRFEILSTFCFTICEVPRRAGNQKKTWLRDP